MTPERYEEATRLALGEVFDILVAELKLTSQEAVALVRLIAAYQQSLVVAAKTLLSFPGKLSRHIRANRRRLDSSIQELVGEERFALFDRYRQTLSDQRCL